MRIAWIVARKEIRDHLRDRRSLVSATVMVLMGPGVVLLVSLSEKAAGPGKASVLLGMLSVFALVSSFAGAMDVAMDAATGERERRSLLPLLLNPVRRSDLLVGKWIAVTTFALAGVMLNTIALAGVLGWAAPAVLASQTPLILLWVTLGLVPLAALGAAVNLLVAVVCRSTKEAHTALRIVAFLPMLVGMLLVFFPSWIGETWFVLPIVGQQALIGWRGSSVPIGPGIVLALVTLAAAIPAVWGAARMLDRDDILSA